jgi:hypothetical protein
VQSTEFKAMSVRALNVIVILFIKQQLAAFAQSTSANARGRMLHPERSLS